MGGKLGQLIPLILILFIVICGAQAAYAQSASMDPLWKYKTNGWVIQLAMSGDGQYMAAYIQDPDNIVNSIYFFNINGSRLWQYPARDIYSLAVSSNGDYVAAGYNNGVYLFDRNGTKLWQYSVGNINSIKISGDGQYIIVSNGDLLILGLDGNLKWRSSSLDAMDSDVSLDGQYVAACSYKNNTVYLFDINGNRIWQNNVGGHAYSVAISGDGKYVASGGMDHNVYLFDRNGNKLWQYETAGDIRQVAISPDGRYVAASDLNNNIYLFDRSGYNLWHYEAESRLYYIALSDDGRYVSAVGLNNNVFLIGSNGTRLWQYNASYSTYSMAMPADGQYIAVGSEDKNVYLFKNPAYSVILQDVTSNNGSQKPSVPGADNTQGQAIQSLWQYDSRDALSSIVISGDGQYVAASSGYGVDGASGNGSLYLLDYNGTKKWQYKMGHINSVALSHDGQYIVAGSDDDNVYLFDRNGSLMWKYKAGAPFSAVSMSEDGRCIAAGSNDQNVYVFNPDGTIKWQRSVQSQVDSIAVTGDGRYVIAGTWGGTCYFFDSDGNKKWQQKAEENIYVTTSRDGNSIAATSSTSQYNKLDWNGLVYLFDVDGNLKWQNVTTGAICKAAISGDGRYVAVGAGDGNVSLFNLAGDRLWQRQTSNQVWYITLSDDGQYTLVTISGGEAYLFDQKGNTTWHDTASSAAMSRDGQYFATITDNRYVNLFKNTILGTSPAANNSTNQSQQPGLVPSVSPGTNGSTSGNIGNGGIPGEYYLVFILVVFIIVTAGGGYAIINGRGKGALDVSLETSDVLEGDAAEATVNIVAGETSSTVQCHVRLSGKEIDSFSEAGVHKLQFGRLIPGNYTVTACAIGKDKNGGDVRKNVERKFTVKPAVPKVKLEALPIVCTEGEYARATVLATNISEHAATFDGTPLGRGASKEFAFDVDTSTVGEHSKKVTINYGNVAGREFSGVVEIKYTVQPADPAIDVHVDSIDIAGNMGIASLTIVNRSDYPADFGDYILRKGEAHQLTYDLDTSKLGSHEKIAKLQYKNRAGRPFEKEFTIAYTVHGPEAEPQAATSRAPSPQQDGGVPADKLVFISYATKDKIIADAVCHGLEQQKIRCWISPRDVLPGMVFEKAIVEAINSSDIFIIIYSSYSNKSPHVENEVREAWRTGIPIIPFRIEDVPMSEVLRYYISSKHWLDAMTPPLQEHIDNLTHIVLVLLNSQK